MWENGPGDDELEECIDELDSAIEGLGRFPPLVLALALRAHLLALLDALEVSGQLGEQELRDFLCQLQLEAERPDEGER